MSRLTLVTRDKIDKFNISVNLYKAYKRANKRGLMVAGYNCWALFKVTDQWYEIDHIEWKNEDDLILFIDSFCDFAENREKLVKINVCHQDIQMQNFLADLNFSSIVSSENEDIYSFSN